MEAALFSFKLFQPSHTSLGELVRKASPRRRLIQTPLQSKKRKPRTRNDKLHRGTGILTYTCMAADEMASKGGRVLWPPRGTR